MSGRTLEECEAVIEKGLETYIEVGEALTEIRDRLLYRDGYATFELYCRERWRFVASRARQLIGAVETARVLETVTNVTPANEAQARELAPLRGDPKKMAEVWERVVERTDGKPTTLAVRRAVQAERTPCLTPKLTTTLSRIHDLARFATEVAPTLSQLSPDDLVPLNFEELDKFSEEARKAREGLNYLQKRIGRETT